jgi:ElaB/YqjD/DUF883 family membrane-anchored ribosome-binding protein
MMNQNIATTKDRLVTDLKNVVADSEELLKEMAGELSERGKQARQRLMASIESAKQSYGSVQERARAGAEATNAAVREHPYTSLGVAFGVGLVLGVLMFRDH